MLPHYKIHDPSFRWLIQPYSHLEKLVDGCRWTEGPVWFPASQMLLFSDIPNQRIMRLTQDDQVSVFRQPSGFSNGNTRDREGRLVTCHHGTRSVTRTEHDGSITILADQYEGKRLNSPNDVVVKSDGSIWFTDPTYGIFGNYEGHRATPEQDTTAIYRIGTDGKIKRVGTGFVQPNGLAFSNDESLLYVSESGLSHYPGTPSVIRAFDVQNDSLANMRDICTIDKGVPDGFRIDRDGNIWSSAGDGVQVFNPDGKRIGQILVPEPVANLTFGGPSLNRLYITAATSVYSVYLETEPQ